MRIIIVVASVLAVTMAKKHEKLKQQVNGSYVVVPISKNSGAEDDQSPPIVPDPENSNSPEARSFTNPIYPMSDGEKKHEKLKQQVNGSSVVLAMSENPAAENNQSSPIVPDPESSNSPEARSFTNPIYSMSNGELQQMQSQQQGYGFSEDFFLGLTSQMEQLRSEVMVLEQQMVPIEHQQRLQQLQQLGQEKQLQLEQQLGQQQLMLQELIQQQQEIQQQLTEQQQGQRLQQQFNQQLQQQLEQKRLDQQLEDEQLQQQLDRKPKQQELQQKLMQLQLQQEQNRQLKQQLIQRQRNQPELQEQQLERQIRKLQHQLQQQLAQLQLQLQLDDDYLALKSPIIEAPAEQPHVPLPWLNPPQLAYGAGTPPLLDVVVG